MSKKVLILSGSPRKGGNSDLLCGEFARGAQENGNEVEIIRVAAKKIAPCSGCYYCRAHNGECAHKDDMAEVLQKMIDADVIVMASPVYFYSIDAQLKAVIDRTVARWLEVKNKDFYYIVTMADEDVCSADTTLACLRGYAACVRGAQEKAIRILLVSSMEWTTCAKVLLPIPFLPRMISRLSTITARAKFRTIPAAICCGGCLSRRATPPC